MAVLKVMLLSVLVSTGEQGQNLFTTKPKTRQSVCKVM